MSSHLPLHTVALQITRENEIAELQNLKNTKYKTDSVQSSPYQYSRNRL